MIRRIALLGSAGSVHVVRWANALASRGREIHLISMHPPSPSLRPEVHIHPLPVPAPAGYVLNARSVRAALRTIRPEVLNTHFASGYGTLGRLSRFHPHALSVWGSDIEYFPNRSRIHRRILCANLASADRIFATSQALLRGVRDLAPGVPATQTPFGVDVGRFSPRTKAEPGGSVTVGTVRSLKPVYGIDLLLRGFARAVETLRRTRDPAGDRMRLRVVGGGPEAAALQSLARELGISDRTEFRGRISHDRIPEELHGFEVFVAPSRREGLGVAVLEAAACGVPVVASRVGGLPETVDDGRSGILLEPEDVDALATALIQLCTDAGLRARMGRHGREWVLDRFAWEDCISTMEDALELVGRSHGEGE
ncbi:MAG: glycosyltransferase [Gemmatimonadota bacterium]|nr:glycosyltransferase [Gemmatimonadota bacterium]